MFTIHLAKEPFKFSCSHFTIFSADGAERLHGHNYQVQVDITVEDLDPQLGMAFDFNSVKPLIREFCNSLDERILLPSQSVFLQLKELTRQLEVNFGSKHYVFPKEDVLSLPLVNITSEELARYATQHLIQAMAPFQYWTSISVKVEETRGQSASYVQSRKA